MRDSHLKAILLAIQHAPETLEELSICFTLQNDQMESPFIKHGTHYHYLSYLNSPLKNCQSPYETPAHMQNVYMRLAHTKYEINGLTPRDGVHKGNFKQSQGKALQHFVSQICDLVKKMRNLKILALYNLNVQLLTENAQTALESGVYHVSQRQFNAFILTNCDLGHRNKSLLETLMESFSLKLLVLQNVQLSQLQQITELIQKHRQNRNDLFFQKALRRDIEFQSSKSKLLSQSELLQKQLHNGLQFIDFSNNMNPALCQCVCEALADDKYVSYVNLEGNQIDLNEKVLRKTDYVIKMNGDRLQHIENVQTARKQAAKPQKDIYLPIHLCTQINAIEQSKKNLDPYEQIMLSKTVLNYQNLKNLQTIQLLQCYADDEHELAELMNLQQHPVVKLLLTNYFITYFNVGQCSEVLRNFINQRLTLNIQTLEETIRINANVSKIEDSDLSKSLQLGLKSPQNIIHNIQQGTPIRGRPLAKRCSSSQKECLKKNMKDKFDVEDENLVKVGAKSEFSKGLPQSVKIERPKSKQTIEWQPVGCKEDFERAKVENKKVMLYWDYKKQIKQPQPSKAKLLSLQKQIEEKTKELEKLEQTREKLLQETPKAEKTIIPKEKDQKSDDEELFEIILNAAYELVMEKSGRNKLKALGVFNQHQDHILGKCEDILNLVKSGQMKKDTINGRLKQMVDIQ